MNVLQNKAFIGAATITIGYALTLLRALGLNIPPSVDAPLYGLLAGVVSLVMIYHGWKDALDQFPPGLVSVGAATFTGSSLPCLHADDQSPDGQVKSRPCMVGESGPELTTTSAAGAPTETAQATQEVPHA